jgi:orotidine-5'-phosphate decarboxylase
MPKNEQLLVGLDVESGERALALASQISGIAGGVKVGKRLFTLEGPSLVRTLVSLGLRVFLDLKYHDIPNTVAQAVDAAAHLGVWVCNVHCMGGYDMLKAARDSAFEYAANHNGCRPFVIGVTVLTSHNEDSLRQIGYPEDVNVKREVERLARLAAKAGLDGVVCSAQEASIARQVSCDESFLVITPGIRLAGTEQQDQKRVDTPAGAKNAGASHIVVARPIINHENPGEAARAFVAELES